jgi:RNA polymerase sigma factor (sigma-70 family)
MNSETTASGGMRWGETMKRLATKTMLDEMIEFDAVSDEAAAEAQAEVEAVVKAARKRRNERDIEADKPTAAILPIYLREMGATPLIDENREVELARELQDGRVGLARIALRLPATCREYVLEGDTSGPKRGREWPLDQLETFYQRFARYAKEHRESKIAAALRDAREHKRHIDHARDALILANLRLVVHIAKKYLNHGISFMDLIQEGNIGLMKAVEKFEYERGNKFSTYAYWWIKQAIERAIADKARIIRIPVHVNEKIKKISRVARELTETLGRKPTPPEIAKKLRMPVAKVEEILGVVQEPQALEDMSASDDDSPGLLRFVADPNAPSPLEKTVDRELREKIKETLRVLNSREEEIIRLRFGIGRDMPYTLEEIGRVMGLSRERVRQIEATALKKIQSAQECVDLREFLA